ncbi:MAG: WXG100 family type VII secretion target [Anaerolineales bacterium]|nr:WXG100 family type VII secretion target [Anaerolineales bacterium]MCX7754214.1 WXG100 family type VII secretion target [Anaerolineales bacterium]MDW8276936.1 WXG100 family type VII secretion target [Anaerolineales bacterium]
MAGLLQVNYDEMQGIIKLLEAEEQEHRALLQQTKSKVDALHGDGWVGQGADQFFNEMNGTVLPAHQKMVHALDVAGKVASQIVQIIRSADEETRGFFNNIGA